VTLQDVRFGTIDCGMTHGGYGRKKGARHCRERPKARSTHFGPAWPAIVEPPIMMVQHEGNLALCTRLSESPCQEQIAPQPLIVRPHQAPLGYQLVQAFLQMSSQASGEHGRFSSLLGKVAGSRHDRTNDRYRSGPLSESVQPRIIRGLSRQEYDLGDQGIQGSEQVWNSEFDDPPHPSRTEMAVYDDQIQPAEIWGREGSWANCFGLNPAKRFLVATINFPDLGRAS